jgi:hypothetical protein
VRSWWLNLLWRIRSSAGVGPWTGWSNGVSGGGGIGDKQRDTRLHSTCLPNCRLRLRKGAEREPNLLQRCRNYEDSVGRLVLLFFGFSLAVPFFLWLLSLAVSPVVRLVDGRRGEEGNKRGTRSPDSPGYPRPPLPLSPIVRSSFRTRLRIAAIIRLERATFPRNSTCSHFSHREVITPFMKETLCFKENSGLSAGIQYKRVSRGRGRLTRNYGFLIKVPF